MDARMLTYTSAPAPRNLQITGSPVVSLYVSSTESDGAFLVYLEDVSPDGKSTYITEGGLRAIDRKISTNPDVPQLTPYHSFAMADAMPLAPGQLAHLSFELLPTSVLIRKGHRIRVAIAGADRDNLERIPADGTPTMTIARDRVHSSYISIPFIVGAH